MNPQEMIPVFQADPHIAARLQDAIAAHMLSATPRSLRPLTTGYTKASGIAPKRETPTEPEAIIEAFVSGESISAILQRFRIGKAYLYRLVDESGIPRRKGNLAATMQPEIRSLRAGGLSHGKIAKKLNMKKAYVGKICREYGL